MVQRIPQTLWALLASFVLVLASIVAAPSVQAQATSPYRIDSVEVTPDQGSTDANGNLKAWSGVSILVNWSAPNGVHPTDRTFAIEFPKDQKGNALLALKQSKEFDLKDSSNGTIGGSCVAEATSARVICNLNDAFLSKEKVHGTVMVEASNRGANADVRSYNFRIGESEYTWVLPGNKQGIVGEPAPIAQGKWKSGWFEADRQTLTWALYVPGSELAKKDSNNSPITITDAIPADGGDHTFKCAADRGYIQPNNGTGPRVVAVGYSADVAKQSDIDTKAEHKLKVSNQKLSNSDKSMEMTIEAPAGGWRSDYTYTFKYHTCVTGASKQYKNEAKINGQELGAAVVDYKDGAAGTIQGVDRGSYIITKKLTEDSAKLDPNQTFKVKVVVDAVDNSLDSEEVVEIKADGVYAGKKTLPEGTKVTITEPELPSVSGVNFGEPQFKADDKHFVRDVKNPKGVEIEIKSDSNASVIVTNSATNVPGSGGGGSSDGKPWWLALFALPFLAGASSNGSSDSTQLSASAHAPAPSASATATPAAGAPNAANSNYNGQAPAQSAQKGVPRTSTPAAGAQQQSQNKNLANTGASVLFVALLAIILIGAGAFFLIRSRSKKSES